jgi:hypothetical protein
MSNVTRMHNQIIKISHILDDLPFPYNEIPVSQ